MFRITIFAARRVLPPLLITPAKASKPFIKLTGPDAMPPPERVSLLPRRVEKLVPVPEPHLKSIPSVRVRPMMDSMLSDTELSRSRDPGLPWKYLLVTMLVAVCDQFLGTSTPSWRKMVTPFSLPISAVRFSHSTMSNGEVWPSVKYRLNTSPVFSPLDL